MPFSAQLIDAQNDQGLKNVSGKCSSSVEFVAQVNGVTRQLMKRGSWFGNEVVVQMCVQGCEPTFPRYVHSVLGVKSCGAQIPIKNNWYAIAGPGGGFDCGSSFTRMFDVGLFPCYNEVSGNTGKKIAYHVVKNIDIGKTITIYGTKYGGQPLQEKDADGNWRDGVTIAATSAGGVVLPAMTTELVTKITHIVREATQGMTYLYEYDTTELQLRDLATYEPNETNPQYRRYHIDGINAMPSYVDSYGRRMRKIDCLVKLQFVPLVNVWDFLMIDDFDALRFGIQASRKDDAGEAEEAEKFWLKSVRELNLTDRSRNGGSATVVKVRALGSSAMIANPH